MLLWPSSYEFEFKHFARKLEKDLNSPKDIEGQELELAFNMTTWTTTPVK